MPHPILLRLAVLLSLLLPAVAAAAVIEVDAWEDARVEDGNCTLREAITAAVTDLPVDGCPAGEPGEDVVVLGDGTFTLAAGGEGQLVVEGPLIIRGQGAETTVLDGARVDRLFEVRSGGTLRLEDLQLVNGQPPDETGPDAKGRNGGAILAAGAVHLERCLLVDNAAGRGGPDGVGGDGGALHVSAALTVNDSELRGNASGNGGVTMAAVRGPGDGGAISASGAITIRRSRFLGNHLGRSSGGGAAVAYGRGAAVAASGRITVRDSHFEGNGHTGQWANDGTVWAGDQADLQRVSFIDNSARRGAAAYLTQSSVLTNVVMQLNTAGSQDGAPGGALAIRDRLFQLHSLTITGNLGGGIAANASATAFVRNALVVGNLGGDGSTPVDCAGAVEGIRFQTPNLLSAVGGCESGTADVIAEDPGLEPLQQSAHFVPRYLPLKTSSPARGVGSCVAALVIGGAPRVGTDILGSARPTSGPCDIGASEFVDSELRIQITEELPGAQCAAGGSRIDVVVDANFDGVVDEAELEGRTWVCHGEDGAPGDACTVEEDDEGSVIVRCEDGTEVVVPPGPPGADGQDGQNGQDGADGQDGSEGHDGSDGATGAAGEACTVAQTDEGGATISCPDGSSAHVAGASSGGCHATGGASAPIGLLGAAALLWWRRRQGVGGDEVQGEA